MTTHITIATGNKHKIEEFQSLFVANNIAADVDGIVQQEVPFSVEETGCTFEENAYIKAIAGFNYVGSAVIADDSGLEVRALDWSPGVYSARYSGDDATDASNRRKLLNELDGITDRGARFRCVLAFHDGLRTLFAEGICEGTIATEERGFNGFGYDSLFVPDGCTETFAEMTADEKHRISHRASAVHKLALCFIESEIAADPPMWRPVVEACIGAAIGSLKLVERAAANVSSVETARVMYEGLLQTYLFCGFPAALEALTAFSNDMRVRGVVLTHQPVEAINEAELRIRGDALCRKIYGSVYDRMMQRLVEVSPDLQAWMIIEGYGKVLSRPGMDLGLRQTCIVAVLAATNRKTQLISHVRGAIAGNVPLQWLNEVSDTLASHQMQAASTLLDETVHQFL